MKVAFVGFRHAHMHLLYQHAQAMPELEIVAACEEDAATRLALAERGAIQITHDRLDTMLAETQCAVVAVGDYYGRRGALVQKLLAQGKHVIVDKPICTTLGELAAIEAQVAATGLKVGCMLDLRDAPQVTLKWANMGERLTILRSTPSMPCPGSPAWTFTRSTPHVVGMPWRPLIRTSRMRRK